MEETRTDTAQEIGNQKLSRNSVDMFLLAGLLKVQAPRVTYFSLVQVKFNRNLFKCSGRDQNHWFRIGTVAQVIRIHLKVVFTAGGIAKWVHPAKHGPLNLWYRINRDSALIGVWPDFASSRISCSANSLHHPGQATAESERGGTYILHYTQLSQFRSKRPPLRLVQLALGLLPPGSRIDANHCQTGPVNLRLQKEVSRRQAYPVSGNEQ